MRYSLPDFSHHVVLFQAKKIKPKGTVQELRLVQSINHHGVNTMKAEQVKTLQQGSAKMPSASQHNRSSSPIRHPRIEMFDSEPIPCDLEVPAVQKKHQTMVFIVTQ